MKSTECSACRIQMEDGAGKRTLHPIQYLALGYGFSRVEDIKAHVVGVRLSKSFEFSTRN